MNTMTTEPRFQDSITEQITASDFYRGNVEASTKAMDRSNWITDFRFTDFLGSTQIFRVYGRATADTMLNVGRFAATLGTTAFVEYRVTSWGKSLKGDDWSGVPRVR